MHPYFFARYLLPYLEGAMFFEGLSRLTNSSAISDALTIIMSHYDKIRTDYLEATKLPNHRALVKEELSREGNELLFSGHGG